MVWYFAPSFFLSIVQISVQVLSQQLMHSPLSEPSWPNITDSCFLALNETVSCPTFLQRVSVDYKRLTTDELDALCTSTCRNTMRGVRSDIVNACKGPTDMIQYFDGVNYPATFVIDHYLHTYEIACRKDPTTQEYCDTLLVQWLSNTNWTQDMECHDCILGTQQTLLKSPFDYTEEFAEDFASLTSSCGSTQYSYATPGPYAMGTRASDAVLPSPTCTNAYTVTDGETCNNVSTAHNVSTYAITDRNSLYSDCSNLGIVGNICVPESCNIYQVQNADTCDSIIESYGNGVSGAQFLAWNPNINDLCSNLGDIIGRFICLSPPGGLQRAPAPVASAPITAPTAAVPRPTNSFPESNSRCGKWYNITIGDTCEKLSVANSITLKDFYFLNPEIYTQCSNLLLGIAYCIQPIGDIHTYSGYPQTTNFITLTSNTSTTSTSTAPPILPFPTPVDDSPLPHASGTIDGCYAYKNARTIPPIQDQSQADKPSLFTNWVNGCGYIQSIWGVSVADFVSWNPSLDPTNCSMQAGFSYCVKKSENYTSDIPKNYYFDFCMADVDSSKIPQGTIASCTCYSIVKGDEWPDLAETCDGIVDETGIDYTNIPIWNPWVGSDCDEGLYAGLAANDSQSPQQASDRQIDYQIRTVTDQRVVF